MKNPSNSSSVQRPSHRWPAATSSTKRTPPRTPATVRLLKSMPRSPRTTAPAPTSMSAKVPSRPNGKPATPWASCLSKPAARHRPRLPNSTTTPPRPHSKVRSTISQRAAAITMPSSPTRRSPAPRPTSRSGTCVRRRATISTAPTTRWSPPPGPTPLTTRRARPTAKTSPSRCTALRRSSISPSPRRPTR